MLGRTDGESAAKPASALARKKDLAWAPGKTLGPSPRAHGMDDKSTAEAPGGGLDTALRAAA